MPTLEIINADLSSFDGKNMMLITGATQTHSISCTLNTGEDCSAATYQVTFTGGPTSLTSAPANIITFGASNILANAGTIIVYVQAKLPTTAWSSIFTGTFTYVNPCTTATFLPSDQVISPHQVLGGAQSVQVLLYDSVSLTNGNNSLVCGLIDYSQHYVSSAPNSVANSTMFSKINFATVITTPNRYLSISITSQPTLKAEVGTYIVHSKVFLTSYPSVQNSFQTTVTVLDPCLFTRISGPTTIENLKAIAGSSQNSSQTYQFNDTVSIQYTIATDAQDYCGLKILSFQINGTATNLLSGSSNQQLTFSPLANSTKFQEENATIIVCLQDYPQICQNFDLSVTTLGFVIPELENQTYQIGSPIQSYNFTPFQLQPASSAQNFKLNRVLGAFILQPGYVIQETLDPACACLQQIQDQLWIKFDVVNGCLSVYSQDSTIVGQYKIVILEVLDQPQYTNVVPYATFYLNITKPFQAPLKAPYFQPKLTTQIVNQCPGQNTLLWNYTLPKIVSPNGGDVTLKIQYDSKVFSFDFTKMILSQVSLTKAQLSQIVQLLLVDKFGQQANYELKIQFMCSQNSLSQNLSLDYSEILGQKQFPNVQIMKINQNGLVHIRFYSKMVVPIHPERIQNDTVIINGTQWPIVQLSIIPGTYTDKKMLNFNWTFVNYTAFELLIQLHFENRLYVSSHSLNQDQLQIQIFGYQYFVDVNRNYIYPEAILVPKFIPQVNTQEIITQYQQLGQTITQTMTAAFTSNFVLSLFISGPIQQILDSIKQLQIVLHLLIVKVPFPASSTAFFCVLMEISTFQFYDFTYLFINTLNLDDQGQQPFSEQFGFMGYGSKYLILNFGTLCCMILITPLLWIITPVIVYFSHGQLAHLRQTTSRMMFFRSWIQLYFETYLFLGVCAALNFNYLLFNNYGNIINSVISLVVGSIIVILPLCVAILYTTPKIYNLIVNQNEDFMQRFGSILENLNLKRLGKIAIIHPVVTLFRKLSLIYALVYLQNYPVFTIFLVNLQAVVVIIEVGYVNPYIDTLKNNLELLNECFTLLTNYHLLLFTDYLSNVDTREILGKSLIAVTISNVCINLAIICGLNLLVLQIQLKLWFLKAKQSQRIKEKRQEKQMQLEKEFIEQQVRKQQSENQMQNIQKQSSVTQKNNTATQKTIKVESLEQKSQMNFGQFDKEYSTKKKISKNIWYLDQPIPPNINQSNQSSLIQPEDFVIPPLKIQLPATQTPKPYMTDINKWWPTRAQNQEKIIQTVKPDDESKPIVIGPLGDHTVIETRAYQETTGYPIKVKTVYKQGVLLKYTVLLGDQEQKSIYLPRYLEAKNKDKYEAQLTQVIFDLQSGILDKTIQKLQMGEVEKVLEKYAEARHYDLDLSMNSLNDKANFGDYDISMSNAQKMMLYKKIMRHQDQKQGKVKANDAANQKNELLSALTFRK